MCPGQEVDEAEFHSCSLIAHCPVHISPSLALGLPGDPMFLSPSPAPAADCPCCPTPLACLFHSYQLLPHAILTALHTLVTLLESLYSCGQSHVGASNQRATCAQRVSKDPRRGGPWCQICVCPWSSHGIHQLVGGAGGWYPLTRACPEWVWLVAGIG